MELKYIVLTIIKILVSVPTILFTTNLDAEAAALMGGYLDNTNETDGFVGIPFDTEINYRRHETSETYPIGHNSSQSTIDDGRSEEIPNPSPLVIPGYNLPENIFNRGKPFYMEKDPLTGQVDFTNKTPAEIDDDFYEYTDEGNDQTDDIYNKANINRKDGNAGSHRPSDINQLTPNFHDFLNLPIKYNSNKYVYPLISSSYANTKVQGNVNKYHNHKTYVTKYPTFKPPNDPYLSSSTQYYQDYEETTSASTLKPISTSNTTPVKKPVKYQNFNEDFSDDYDYGSYDKNTKNDFDIAGKDVYYTTEKINNIFLTTSSTPITTTKKVMSLLEQLFGVYDETVTTSVNPESPLLFSNHPSNKINNSQVENKLNKITTPSSSTSNNILHTNVATGSNMEMDNAYAEYDDDYYYNQNSSDLHSTNKPQSSSTSMTTPFTTTSTVPSTTLSASTIFNSHSYKEPAHSQETVPTRQRVELTSETYFTSRETSLPLGDNHVSSPKITPMPSTDHSESNSNNYKPIIIATQNLRNQLNNEKVVPKPFSVNPQQIPSTSNIHISPDQDTVSFVVGHHQNMDGSSQNEPNSHNVFNTNYFQPQDDIIYNNSPDTVIFQQPQLKKHQEVSGSVVTIQTQTNSEASLSIGVPVEHIKVPGQVMDAKLEIDNMKANHPTNGAKIVFPDEKDISLTSLVPPPSTSNPPLIHMNREILKLASKPMFHQLPSDLTPPKEELGKFPLRLDSPRPPWDPRPGHFFSGNLEYSRPPRPFPDIAYKRIDTLPNILPQFRPNMKSRGPHNSSPHDYKHSNPHSVHRTPPHFYDNRLHREPLLDRPSNHPIEFYEKLQPPPLPPKNLHNFRKIPQTPQLLDQRSPIAQDRKGEDYHRQPSIERILEPPKIITNLKTADGEVETLQMLQAKQSDKKELYDEPVNSIVQDTNRTDKPVYVVYPVNSPPMKLDVIDTNKRESVVIGTRAELPLPPSEIRDDFIQDKSTILGIQDRNDSPILKPHSRLPPFSMKTDFPYPLERPDISILHPVPDAPNNGIGSEDIPHSDNRQIFLSNNQWNTIDDNTEPRIVSKNKVNSHIYTEKPIAVAYTPTEPSETNIHDTFIMPQFGLSNTDSDAIKTFHSVSTNESPKKSQITNSNLHTLSNHRLDDDVSDDVKIRTEQDFQAPFQASVKVDSPSQGWSIIRKNDSKNNDEVETTSVSAVTISEFDIENFKPQLEGGFKPIYTFRSEDVETKVDERQE